MVQSAWQDALDPQFTQRLLRPWVSPGVIPDALALSILARSQQFKQRLSLLHQFQQRWSRQGQMQVPDIPIVYARWMDGSPDTTAVALPKTDQGQPSSSAPSTQSELSLPGIAPMGPAQQAMPQQQGIATSHVPGHVTPTSLSAFQQAPSQDSPPLPIVHTLVGQFSPSSSEVQSVAPLPRASESSSSAPLFHETSSSTVAIQANVIQANVIQAEWLDSDPTSALTFPLPLPGAVTPASELTTERLAPTAQGLSPSGITSAQSALPLPVVPMGLAQNAIPHQQAIQTSNVQASVTPTNLNVFQQASSQDPPTLPIVNTIFNTLAAQSPSPSSEVQSVAPLPRASESSSSAPLFHETSSSTVAIQANVIQANVIQAEWLDSDPTSALTFPLPLPGAVTPASELTTERLAPTAQGLSPSGITSAQSALPLPVVPMGLAQNAIPHQQAIQTSNVQASVTPTNLNVFQQASSQDPPTLPIVNTIFNTLAAQSPSPSSEVQSVAPLPRASESSSSAPLFHETSSSTVAIQANVIQANVIQAEWLDSDPTSALTFPLPLPGAVTPASELTTERLAPTAQGLSPSGITSAQSALPLPVVPMGLAQNAIPHQQAIQTSNVQASVTPTNLNVFQQASSQDPPALPIVNTIFNTLVAQSPSPSSEVQSVAPLPRASESSSSAPLFHETSSSTVVVQANGSDSSPASVLALPLQLTSAAVPGSELIAEIPEATTKRLDQKSTPHQQVRQTSSDFQGQLEPVTKIPASPFADVNADVKIVSSTTVEQTDLPLTDLPLVTPQHVRTSPLQRDNPEHQPASSDVLSSAVKSAKTTKQQQTTPLVFPEQVVPQKGSQSSSGSSHHRPLIFAKAIPAHPPAATSSPAAAQPLSQRPSPQSSQVVSGQTVSALPSPPLPSTTPQVAHAPPVNINRLTRQVERKLTRRLTVERERRGQRW